MYVNGSSMNVNEASLYSASAAEKAASVQRATDLRRKAMHGEDDIEGIASPDDIVSISQWMDLKHSQVRGQNPHSDVSAALDGDEYHSGSLEDEGAA
jgi:hypothetical protein